MAPPSQTTTKFKFITLTHLQEGQKKNCFYNHVNKPTCLGQKRCDEKQMLLYGYRLSRMIEKKA